MHSKIGTFAENIVEAGAACIVMMVQGNLLVLTAGHWLIASQTGLIAGTFASLAFFIFRTSQRWRVALGLGALTTVADLFVHGGALLDGLLEAVLTGIGAGLLSLLVGRVLSRRSARAAAEHAG